MEKLYNVIVYHEDRDSEYMRVTLEEVNKITLKALQEGLIYGVEPAEKRDSIAKS